MFDIESKNQDEIMLTTKKTSVKVNVKECYVDGNLSVGKIYGPGEFEIGDMSVRGIDIKDGKTIYDVEIGGVHVGIIGDNEKGLDDLGVANILCTSSVRAVREIEPKLVVSMGNVDGMVSELKLTARTEKKLKVKNLESLPATLEVVVLS